ncbi:MAG: hypothetical protein HKO57_01440 [Akkermansiaceae bacterium]|nr:hypothetical protein [Akkermansiaceae bacterium]
MTTRTSLSAVRRALLPGMAAVAVLVAPAASADETAAIAQIRSLYAKITEGEPVKTRKIEFELEDDPMEGTITRRDYKDGLSAITLTYVAGDHGGSDEHYYFDKDGGLFFVFVKDHHWQFAPGKTPDKPTTVDTLTEARYYLAGDACLRVLKRSASGPDAEKLPAAVAKAEHKTVEPGERLGRLRKRATALRTIADREEAAAFFASEE